MAASSTRFGVRLQLFGVLPFTFPPKNLTDSSMKLPTHPATRSSYTCCSLASLDLVYINREQSEHLVLVTKTMRSISIFSGNGSTKITLLASITIYACYSNLANDDIYSKPWAKQHVLHQNLPIDSKLKKSSKVYVEFRGVLFSPQAFLILQTKSRQCFWSHASQARCKLSCPFKTLKNQKLTLTLLSFTMFMLSASSLQKESGQSDCPSHTQWLQCISDISINARFTGRKRVHQNKELEAPTFRMRSTVNFPQVRNKNGPYMCSLPCWEHVFLGHEIMKPLGT